MNGLASLPLPVTNDKSCSLHHGINAAIEVLSQPSQLQHQCRTVLINGEAREVPNRGRIICLSSFKRLLCSIIYLCKRTINVISR